MSQPLVATSFVLALGGFILLLMGFEAFIQISLPHIVVGIGMGMSGMFLLIMSGATFWNAFT